jgi:hypothetical protein
MTLDQQLYSLKEGMLQIFNALKNSSPSAGFDLGSNGKHANNYTTKDNTDSENYFIYRLKRAATALLCWIT